MPFPGNGGVFGDFFAFERGRVAPYTNAEGLAQVAPIHTARLDHDETGAPLGLLIEGRDTTAVPDLIGLTADQIAALPAGPATVLHDFIRPDGEREQRALYTHDAAAMVVACLNMCGWHRRIAAFPGHLERSDLLAGPVRFGGESWDMPGLFLTDDATALSIGGVIQTVLIEG